MTARSIRECSRANSATEIKNGASKGIRITRAIVVIKSSLQPKPVNPSRVLLLPAATEVSVNANQTCKLIQLSLSKSQLGIEVIGFIGQHLQVTGRSASIAHLRKLRRVLGRERQLLLVFPELPVFVVLNQRVRDPATSLLHRLLISQQCLLLPRFSEPDVGTNPSPGENGLHQRSSETPQPSRPGEQTRKC